MESRNLRIMLLKTKCDSCPTSFRVALLTDADSDKPEDYNKVTLMTVHAAKGLEFPLFMSLGWKKIYFPLNCQLIPDRPGRGTSIILCCGNPGREKAFLSYAVSRYRWGNLTQCEPSRFL